MAGKIKLITDLYADTLKEISTNPSQWMNFLDCSAMNYKYPFKDQVLIYAQKPNATACAKVEAWNKQVGRWIVKGAKGIALLDEYNGKIGLNFIFDVEDTWSNLGKSFRLWTVSKAYEPDVIESLQNKYGDLEDVRTLGYAIKSASKIIVEDNIQDYLEDLKAYIKNSSLEYLTDDKVEKIFKITLENSVAYSIMKRCGINPSEYFNEEDFATILSFNNEEIFTRLGVAKSEISEMAIKDIYNTIKKLRTNEIEKIRTFDINKTIAYDLSESNDIAKGRNEDESNLYEARGLHDTRLEDTREQNSSGGQIRNTEIRIPEETQASTLHNIAYEQQTSRTFDGYSESGEGHSGTDSREDEETGELDRGIQSNESNGVGRIDEQLESNGRGTSDKRTDIHLEKLYKDENIKAFFDNKTINNIIKTSPSVKRNIDEIKKFLRENIDDRKKCGEYISNIFGNEYTEYVIKENGKKINYITYIRSMKNEECNRAIVRMIDKIDLDKINRFIDEIPYMSDVRKSFYKKKIKLRYDIIKEVYNKLDRY